MRVRPLRHLHRSVRHLVAVAVIVAFAATVLHRVHFGSEWEQAKAKITQLAHPATSAAPPDRSSAAGGLRVLTEPHAGLVPIYQLIRSARHQIDLTMYELRDPKAETLLEQAAARGIDVRVLLDRHLEQARNLPAYRALRAHGVHVAWAPADTTFHQKTLTVDNRTSVIMTLNLVAADYAGTRDFAVVDTDRPAVRQIVSVFDSDFAGRPVQAEASTGGLMWSPGDQAAIVALIDRATRSLLVENEEMNDPTITAALAAAARRGVDVQVVMTAERSWDQAFSQLTAAGVHVRLYPDSSSALYIHAKVLVVDAGHPDHQVLVGSQNFSDASLDYNRELGVLINAPAVVAMVAGVVRSDYTHAPDEAP